MDRDTARLEREPPDPANGRALVASGSPLRISRQMRNASSGPILGSSWAAAKTSSSFPVSSARLKRT
jgi:hypothetical protein